MTLGVTTRGCFQSSGAASPHRTSSKDINEEVTTQCDASEVGLGATLMQLGQPFANASRALSQTEQRYTQIEKDCLAIVFACEHFDQCIYSRDCVTVQSDHKPFNLI